MRLVAGVLLLAVAIGLGARGRLSGLASIGVRWAPLALVGLSLQYLSPSSGPWPFPLLILSFATLTVFAIANLRVSGFALILAGISMNLLVIGFNHGMPVTRSALLASGQQATLGELVHDGGAKHHLAGPQDRLLFLADVTPLAPPIAQVVSAGDVVAYAGLGWVVVAAMRRARRVAASEDPLFPLEKVPVGAGTGDAIDG